MYRASRQGPYLRSSLARAVYERIQVDEQLKSLNKATWYECNLDLVSEELCDAFMLSTYDEETQAFVERCYEKSDWFFTQLYHSIVRAVLCWFMTQTSINSWLQRGSMFVFSQQQFLELLQVPSTWKTQTLLDLGAGDGHVTAIMAPFFENVHVTEISSGMQSLLASKGYTVLAVDTWPQSELRYDVIAFLNLLDRCDRPLTMLAQARALLRPRTGRLVVALALPFAPYVEVGSSNHLPTEKLAIEGETFEEQVKSVAEQVFEPAGFRLLRWTRTPYLCEGDIHQSFYYLSDAIFILEAKT